MIDATAYTFLALYVIYLVTSTIWIEKEDHDGGE